MSAFAKFADDLIRSVSRVASTPKVYPFYLASRAKRGLVTAMTDDDEKIIAQVGDIETIGGCRYATTVTDHNGTRYRVTVEVEKDGR